MIDSKKTDVDAAVSLPLDVAAPGAPPESARKLADIHTRATELIQKMAVMRPEDLIYESVFRWIGGMCADSCRLWARLRGAEAGHMLMLRILHLLRAVLSDIAYQATL